MAEVQETNKAKIIGNILLEVGAQLMSAGANTERIRITIQRLSEAFAFPCELSITFRALTLTISDEDKDYTFSSVKRTSPHGVNFKMVSAISKMSWSVVEEKWSIAQVETEMERIKQLPHYPVYVTILLVGLAGASFCRIAGGEWIDMVIVFGATCIGLMVRRKALEMNFNPYLAIYFAALSASLITGLCIKTGIVANKEFAFVTAVLFLVPGVPLINSFSDIIDGNLQNGWIRGLHGLVISFTIALALVTAFFLYH